MLADAIARYTRQILDDPDYVFLKDTTLAVFLEAAYQEFRQLVPQEVYEVTYQPTALSAVSSLSLDGTLFGSAATQPRCQRITRVLMVNATTGALEAILTPASSFESLAPIAGASISAVLTDGTRWWLDGRTLRFSVSVTATIQIVYVPDAQTNWTAGVVTGSNVYVDDLAQFHDVIALMAARRYTLKCGMRNPLLEAELSGRLQQMQDFFAETRSGVASRYVMDDQHSNGWGGRW